MKNWGIVRKITKISYLSGVVFLLLGIILSVVNQPAYAADENNPTPTSDNVIIIDPGHGSDERPTSSPQNGEVTVAPKNTQSVINRDDNRISNNQSKKKVLSIGADEASARQNPDLIVRPVLQQQIPGVEFGYVESNARECSLTETTITAHLRVVLPDGVTGSVVPNFHIVHPNPTPTTYYPAVSVGPGETIIPVDGTWPGIDPQVDTIVEIHWGGTLIINGTPEATASLDYFWDARDPCTAEITSTPTVTATFTGTPTETTTVTPTPTNTPGTGPSPTPTNTPGTGPTPTPTNTPGTGPTPTRTATRVVGRTSTATPSGPTNTPGTGTPTVGVTVTVAANQSPTPTSTGVATLPAPGVSATQALIPVTGADLAGQAAFRHQLGVLQQFMVNFGLVLLGAAFVLHAITNKFDQ